MILEHKGHKFKLIYINQYKHHEFKCQNCLMYIEMSEIEFAFNHYIKFSKTYQGLNYTFSNGLSFGVNVIEVKNLETCNEFIIKDIIT
jgi:hypothetical protein